MSTTPTPTVGELETVAWMHPESPGTCISENYHAESVKYGWEHHKHFTVELIRKSDALAHNEAIRGAAQALVDRWETPLWKDAPHTGEYIQRLRAALLASQGGR